MITAIVQARLGSVRFPDKVLKKVNNKPLIQILLERLSRSKKLDNIVLATTNKSIDNKLANFIREINIDVFRGSEENVLDRYYQAAKNYNSKVIVRITGDCPLVDYELVDQIIDYYLENNVDYVSNTLVPSFPDGLDIEVFSFSALDTSVKKTQNEFDLEHVTPFIKNNYRFSKLNFKNSVDYSNHRWTVDELEDFIVIKNILNYFHPDIFFNWNEVIKLSLDHPELFKLNKNIQRDEGAKISTGQKLYKRAKKIIPGGTMLLSKRPELFSPQTWPSYFSKAKGCKIWDLDNKPYIDMSIMGIGTNILGYGHDQVDEAVREVVKLGNMSTLNCPEEVFLAEKLIDIHPWAKMARFARSGGEANAIAIRIARAASGRDKVAICGYHGWHDWYLSANLNQVDSLDSHLLPGLKPNGIPKALQDTTFPFKYNDFSELERIVHENDIGVIKMEVIRSIEPSPTFLQSVRKLATEKNIILIFDECTSGFRQSFGGIHLNYGINPDMAMFGKAMGNGYAITAVIGKEEYMKYAEDTFISSTFWTERIGPTAALKTLQVMNQIKSWEIITKKGNHIKKRWRELAQKYDLPIEITGLPALINFSLPLKDWLKYKTLITQQMQKKRFLASNTVYVCIDHTEDIINEYFFHLDSIFLLIKKCEHGENVDSLIDGSICHSGFARLN